MFIFFFNETLPGGYIFTRTRRESNAKYSRVVRMQVLAQKGSSRVRAYWNFAKSVPQGTRAFRHFICRRIHPRVYALNISGRRKDIPDPRYCVFQEDFIAEEHTNVSAKSSLKTILVLWNLKMLFAIIFSVANRNDQNYSYIRHAFSWLNHSCLMGFWRRTVYRPKYVFL